MRKNIFTQMWGGVKPFLLPLMLAFLVLLPNVAKAKSATAARNSAKIALQNASRTSRIAMSGGDGVDVSRDVPPTDANGVYQICNVDQLKWFRDLVNGKLEGIDRNTAANAILMEDIDLEYEEWEPIGPYNPWGNGPNNIYKGTFDGNYHTISNLKIKQGYVDTGFIGKVNEGKVKNLGIVNADITCAEDAGHIGVIAGRLWHAQIENCYSVGELKLTNARACTNIAGITNCQELSTITNSHTSYSCVYYEMSDNASGADKCEANISADAHETGELAYLLNTNKKEGDAGWGQILDKDPFPVALTASNQVYRYDFVGASTLTLGTVNHGDAPRLINTLCYPVDVKLPDHVKAFTISSAEGNADSSNGVVRMDEVKSASKIVEANTPVVLVNLGGEDATVDLPVVVFYSNDKNATLPDVVSQDGNLLKGVYSTVDISEDENKYRLSSSGYFKNDSESVPAYQCYLEKEGGQSVYYLTTNEPVGEVEYEILSAKNSTCYVSHLKYAGIGTSDYTVKIPATKKIGAKEYNVVQYGSCVESDDNKNFINLSGDNNTKLCVDLPKTIKVVSKANTSSNDNEPAAGNVQLIFHSPEAPEFKLSSGYKGSISVPYGCENVYKTAYNGEVEISANITELDIAKGSINVCGNTYAQGSRNGEINETLVIVGKGSSQSAEKNTITVEKSASAPADEIIRIVVRDVKADVQNNKTKRGCFTIKSGANVSLTIEGENTFKGGKDCAGIYVAEGASLEINAVDNDQKLNCYGDCVANYGGGAGIGACKDTGYGNITINGGTIFAQGCEGGAGIGGGSFTTKPESIASGSITINGGSVTAIYKGDGEGVVSVGAAVGSVVGKVDFFVSDKATFTGTVGDNVYASTTVTLYSGNNASVAKKINKGEVLADNHLAFGSFAIPGISNLVANNKSEKFVLTDATDFYSPSAFTAVEATYVRGFSDNDFNALYLPFSVNVDQFEDCEFYTINMFHQYDTDGDGMFDNITLEVERVPAGSILLANHPYLFIYTGEIDEAEGWKDVEFNLGSVQVAATASPTFDCASMNYKYEFTGYYQSKSADDYADYYVIGVDGETGKTALVNPEYDLPAMRWAMKMTPRDSQFGTLPARLPSVMSIVISGEDGATGISDATAQDSDRAYFGVDGTRQEKMVKGLNIVKMKNGRVIKVFNNK